MAVQNPWDEEKPEGSEAANLADNYLRQARIDLGERLEEMLYGFNTDSNTAPENEAGVKKLKCYPQSSAPTTDSDYGFVYTKSISGTVELFWKDSAGNEKQLTNGGILNVVDADGAVMKTGAQAVAGAKTFSDIVNLKDGSVTSTSGAPTTDAMIANKKYVDDMRSIRQVVNVQTGEVATGTTIIPKDDTIPQITEGVEFMTLAITPKSATNKLKIDIVFIGATNTAAWDTLAVALFQDATANALAVGASAVQEDNNIACIKFTHYMTAGTVAATTFRVRAGSTTAGKTITFNGSSAARKFGGVMASSITITEIQP